MKTFLVMFTLLAAGFLCRAAETQPTPGPKGGRLLENAAPRAEFFIGKDNRVTVTFYDEKLRPVPARGQVVFITAAPKTGVLKVDLEKKDGTLISKLPLPKSGFFDEYQITVQIKASADAQPETFHVRFDLDVCGKCKLREYACICHH